MTDRWQECWEAEREIHVLLKESETLESEREKVINYLGALSWSYRRDLDNIESFPCTVIQVFFCLFPVQF